ncbi:trimeric intracellular cation channel family protein [Nocardiopsis ansamitocini]|uniref:trimeric intracellular cation channel family protein n=1 Tax=Nocardiopsis ansamitocini TaxID=1670832 RepID=UPI002553AD6C|nr:trimeric intracellular cation channel family protein [Nocardiopsis ansamitocini]
MSTTTILLVLDLAGVLAFAVDGALVGIRSSRIDIVGVITLGVITALGGGIIRDLLLGATPATFQDWRYVMTALVGALLAFFLSRHLERLSGAITFLDAAGLSLFCVTGAAKALEFGFGPLQAALLGAITGVGGGTLRDVLINRVPAVMSRDSTLYAIPALTGACILVGTVTTLGGYGPVGAVAGALVCFTLRTVGLRYRWRAPAPRGTDNGG